MNIVRIMNKCYSENYSVIIFKEYEYSNKK